MRLEHPFEPVFDEKSSVLILGTFPSVKSRERGFYYGHPQNRFWKIISRVTKTYPIPETITDKRRMLLENGIALFDALQSCDIEGSSDSDIKNAVPADLSPILNGADIKRVCANGEKAYRLLMKYFRPNAGLEIRPLAEPTIIKLPSTSPANARYGFERLVSEWEKILEPISINI
jgi:hypoxanthine-DNA glycosylase